MDNLDNAPRALINLVEHPNPFRGKDTLLRLLTDPRMETAWKEIDKRLFKDPKVRRWDQARQYAHRVTWYQRIWDQIQDALMRSCVPPPPRTKKRDRLNRVAEEAKKLADSIANGPLDRLSFEFFPIDMAQREVAPFVWTECSLP